MNENQFRTSMQTIKNYIDNSKGSVSWNDITDKPAILSTASDVPIADTANNFTATNVEGALSELFQSVSNGKTLIASAITDKGIPTSNIDTFEVMAANIGNIITSSSSDTLVLNYNFDNATAGYAGGTISLTSTDAANDGNYEIYWANDSTILTGYAPIDTFTMSGANSVQTYRFIDRTAIPVNATRIVALNEGNISASRAIPVSKRFTGNKLYSFGLLSDVHIDGDGNDEADSNADLTKIFQFFNNNEDIAMVCTTGDMTRDGRTSDCEEYNRIKNTYLANTPIWTCRGNHDSFNNCSSLDYYLANLEPNGLYYQKTYNNDLFLFIGWHGDYQQPFSSEEIAWLEPILEANRNRRVFLFIHPFLTTGTGNPHNLYPFQAAVCDVSTGNSLAFYQMMQRYRNVILLHGHSHFEFLMQRVDDDANCHPRRDNMCAEIHVPSSGNPRRNDANTEDVYGNSYDYYPGSQGYICDVYENHIILRGRDFETDSFVPLAQYIINTTPIEIPAEGGSAPATYTITNNLTNVTTNNSANSIQENASYSATLTANSGYNMSSIAVTMGGTNITNSVVSGNVITIPSVTGNVVITATATQQQATTYTVTNNLTNITNSNSAVSVVEGSSYSATLSANDGYELSTATVTMGGIDITSTAYSNGTITIDSVTGDIVITATATATSSGGGGSESGPQLGELAITWEAGGINTSGTVGALNNNETERRTAAIPVNPAYTYTLTDNSTDMGSLLCCFAFDADGNGISRFGGNSGNYINNASSYVIPNMPSNCAYIRFRITDTNSSNTPEIYTSTPKLTLVASN